MFPHPTTTARIRSKATGRVVRSLLCVPLLLCAVLAKGQVGDPLQEAQRSGKPALIHFTGSDWCANCRTFERDVLSVPQVRTALHEGYVHYTADRPVRRALPPETEELNRSLVERFNPANTFPLLVVVGTDGQVLDRIAFERAVPAERYVERLRKWSSRP